jgi:hypothetical protein
MGLFGCFCFRVGDLEWIGRVLNECNILTCCKLACFFFMSALHKKGERY